MNRCLDISQTGMWCHIWKPLSSATWAIVCFSANQKTCLKGQPSMSVSSTVVLCSPPQTNSLIFWRKLLVCILGWTQRRRWMTLMLFHNMKLLPAAALLGLAHKCCVPFSSEVVNDSGTLQSLHLPHTPWQYVHRLRQNRLILNHTESVEVLTNTTFYILF